MELIFGTTNHAKLKSMKQIMTSFNIELVGLDQVKESIPFINENGADPLENAVIKATALYKTLKKPLFSCDSGLFFDNIDSSLQPGTKVRRVNGRVLTDDEMIHYYADLAGRYKNKLVGRYKNAICFILDDNHIFKSMDDRLSTEPFLLVDKPHKKRIQGYPIDSLSVDLKTNKYYYDLINYSVDNTSIHQGFYTFFKDCFSQL